MDEVEDIDTRVRKLLEKSGSEFVKGVVEEFVELHREIAALKRELAALTAYQASQDRLLTVESTIAKLTALPHSVVVEPDQMLRAQDGFYPLEHTSDGIPFRWTGPEQHFSFDVFIDRTHGAEARLEILNCIDFEVQKNIALLVDGENVPVTLEQVGMGFIATSALLPRSVANATNLVYALPATLMPLGSKDTRALGVAFGRFTVVSSVPQ
jgi:hypothetical protein